jgi:hypothetical protein
LVEYRHRMGLGTPMTSDFSLTHQIKCVEREIGFRERVYPRWVADGKMTSEQADYQVQCMRAVLTTLQTLLPQERKPMTKDEAIVGTRVRSLHNFWRVPRGTEGVIDEDYDTGVTFRSMNGRGYRTTRTPTSSQPTPSLVASWIRRS